MKLVAKVHKSWIYLMLFCLLSANPVWAQAATQSQVSVTVVLASSNGGEVDPRLNSIIQDLQKLFTQYSYKKLDQFDMNLGINEEKSFDIDKAASVQVRFLGVEGDKVNLKLRIKENKKDLINTNFSITKGGTIIIGGPERKDGKLVLAIKATIAP